MVVDETCMGPPTQVASKTSLAARYEALFRVSQAISAQRDPKDLFCVLARELRHVIRFDGIGVAQYDEAAKQVRWHVAERCSQPFTPLESPSEETMACWVYKNQKPRQADEIRQRLEEEARLPSAQGWVPPARLSVVCPSAVSWSSMPCCPRACTS
jgi:hypothetical protein